MSLKDRIAAMIGRNKPTGRGSVSASNYQYSSDYFKISYERAQIHRDISRMDKTCEIVNRSHTIYADRATGMEDPTIDVFQVMVQPEDRGANPASEAIVSKANQEIDALISRLNLRFEAWQSARRTPKFGNEFRENVIDWEAREIVDWKLLPEQTMWPATDKMGNRLMGFLQKTEGGGEPTQFKEYEVTHFAWGEIDGYLGTPLFGCARKNWKRLNMAEDITAIQRFENMGPRWEHDIPVGSSDPMEEQQKAIDFYKKNMTTMDFFNQTANSIEKWEAPTSVKKDFFLPDDGTGRGGIKMHEPTNAQLSNLKDLEHFMNRLITASGIPKRYFPFEGSTPKLSEGGGNSEDKHFACAVMSLQMILKRGLAQLFDVQLLLKGIDPSSVRYVFRMSEINTTDQFRIAQTTLTNTKALEILLKEYPELRTELPTILREYEKQLSDASYQTLSAVKVEARKEEPQQASENNDNRAQMPGAGAGTEARTKV